MTFDQKLNFNGKGQDLYRKAKKLIPGGTGLLGKRSELYLPELWPAYYKRAKGIEIWDLDDNKYLDFTMVGIGTSILGYADDDVVSAVSQALANGSMTTLNPPEEVELAELLCEFHPWASKVKYARTGGEIMSMAIRIARASTGRSKIALCGYHGWHDWYLSVNLSNNKGLDNQLLPGLEPLGVAKEMAGTAMTFNYNNIESLKELFRENPGEIAAIVLEPVRSEMPQDGFLEEVRKIATDNNAVLIFDEITSGWRTRTSGVHMDFGVTPDLATFAKTMSNGIPMAALIGIGDVMDYAQRTFISSAYWTERLGPVAALATLKKHAELDVGPKVCETGLLVKKLWQEVSDRHGMNLKISGLASLATFQFKAEDPAPIMTLHVQNMLKQGFLASNQFYATNAHTVEDVNKYIEAFDKSMAVISAAVSDGVVLEYLEGPIKHMGFARLT